MSCSVAVSSSSPSLSCGAWKKPSPWRGDSGALIVRREPGAVGAAAAVGLLIGGRPQQETYMLTLKPALAALKMALVSGHG